VFALVTDLLDVQEYPALDLACAYPMRWGCETVIGHHKTTLGPGMAVLRSKDPEGVAQEMWAMFAVYQAMAQLIGAGVDTQAIPPGSISFRTPWQPRPTRSGRFPPGETDLALAVFFLKLLDPAFYVRTRPDQNVPARERRRKPVTFPPGNPANPPCQRHPPNTTSPTPTRRIRLTQGH
jgi:hypothetical protein